MSEFVKVTALAITIYPKSGVFPLNDKEKDIIKNLKKGQKKIIGDLLNDRRLEVIENKNGSITITVFEPILKYEVFNKEQFLHTFKDIVSYFIKNQPIRKKDLERHFGRRVNLFFEIANHFNLIKKTGKGFLLEVPT